MCRNWPTMSWRRLESYVRSGGGVAFFVGADTDRTFYNDRLYQKRRRPVPRAAQIADATSRSRRRSHARRRGHAAPALSSPRRPAQRLSAAPDGRLLLSLCRMAGSRPPTAACKSSPACATINRSSSKKNSAKVVSSRNSPNSRPAIRRSAAGPTGASIRRSPFLRMSS